MYSIALLTTTFKDVNHKTIICPNSLLLAQELTNLSRSPQPVHYIPVTLDAAVLGSQIQELKEKVEGWVKVRGSNWSEKVVMTLTADGVSANGLKCVVRVEQQGSWGDLNRTRANLLEVIAFIAETVAKMQIRAKTA